MSKRMNKKAYIIVAVIIAFILIAICVVGVVLKNNRNTLPESVYGVYKGTFATEGEREYPLDMLGYNNATVTLTSDAVGITLKDNVSVTDYEVVGEDTDRGCWTIKIGDGDNMLAAIVYEDGTLCMGNDSIMIFYEKGM